MRGRRAAGPEYVEKLTGPAQEKRRLEVILRTLSGECRVAEACEMLGVCESRFHALRHQALQAALDGLAPRPPGRPAAPPTAAPAGEDEARLELEAARVGEEIALVLPALAAKAAAGKRHSRRKGGRRK